jgi:hypothetical protein
MCAKTQRSGDEASPNGKARPKGEARRIAHIVRSYIRPAVAGTPPGPVSDGGRSC